MSLSLTDQTELRLPEWKKKKVSAEYHISHEAYQPFSTSFSTWIQKSRACSCSCLFNSQTISVCPDNFQFPNCLHQSMSMSKSDLTNSKL